MSTHVRYPNHMPVRFIIKNPNEHIQKHWKAGTFYETQKSGVLNHIYANPKSKGVILDIGASIGNHTIFFSQICKAKKVYAFEPSLDSYDHLVENIDENKALNVEALNCALGEKKGSISMLSVSDVNVGMKQVNETGSGIDLIRLDDLELTEVDLVKIDVEHYNKELLNGALKTFDKLRPDIYIEAETKPILEETKRILSSIGYTIVPNLVFNHTPTYLFKP